jgi:hypothetical protein
VARKEIDIQSKTDEISKMIGTTKIDNKKSEHKIEKAPDGESIIIDGVCLEMRKRRSGMHTERPDQNDEQLHE